MCTMQVADSTELQRIGTHNQVLQCNDGWIGHSWPWQAKSRCDDSGDDCQLDITKIVG